MCVLEEEESSLQSHDLKRNLNDVSVLWAMMMDSQRNRLFHLDIIKDEESLLLIEGNPLFSLDLSVPVINFSQVEKLSILIEKLDHGVKRLILISHLGKDLLSSVELLKLDLLMSLKLGHESPKMLFNLLIKLNSLILGHDFIIASVGFLLDLHDDLLKISCEKVH